MNYVKYDFTPWLMVTYQCSGDDCTEEDMVIDSDGLQCGKCGHTWASSEAYDLVDGDPPEPDDEGTGEGA
jgi:hypothetical protein